MLKSIAPREVRDLVNRFLLLGLARLITLIAVASGPLVLADQARLTTIHSVEQPHIEASLISRSSTVVAGETIEFALRLRHDEGWHSYWINPGDTGLATTVEWDLPAGFRAGEIEWPVPERINFQDMINFGYHGETWLLMPIAVPSSLSGTNGDKMRFNATAKWLVCRDVCIPGQAAFSLQLPIAEQQSSVWDAEFKRAAEAMPVFVENAAAEFTLGDVLTIHIDASTLPTFNQRPEAFIGLKTVAQNGVRPAVSVQGEQFVVVAEKDPYLQEEPDFLPLVLTAGHASQQVAVSLLAKRSASLASKASTRLASVQGQIDNDIAGVDSSRAELNLLWVLLFALLGGLILNAMPCVFPVLSLKVLSLVESGNHTPTIRQRHGLAYTAGVVLSFLVVATTLIVLRLLGEQIGWGFQLQSPWFVGVLIYVLFILGLSLSGLLEIGGSLQNVGTGAANRAPAESWRASFFTGVLATVVATPCTAPFMGTAMGFALSQPVAIALLVFTVMGLGLALPFLVIAFIPALASKLPVPGNWMVRLKELLAFPIYLTVVWLLWVFARQTGTDAVASLLVGLVLLAFAAWLHKTTLYQHNAWIYRLGAATGLFCALLLLLIGAGTDPLQARSAEGVNESGDVNTAAYSAELLESSIERHDTVFVNMTADWCITCKVNERVALKHKDVLQAFAAQDVFYIKGDWTHSDPAITRFLESFNRNGVPLYVVYRKGEQPQVLPQILTPSLVIDAIKK